MNRLVLGCDPGLSGGLAVYCPERRVILAHMPMPTKEKVNGKKEIDGYGLSMFVAGHNEWLRFAVVEDVHAMPDQGVVSMFTFGETLGVLKGVLAAYGIPVVLVSPAVWKSTLGLGNDKKEAISMANELFPVMKLKKSQDGVAEAALLAIYGDLYGPQTSVRIPIGRRTKPIGS